MSSTLLTLLSVALGYLLGSLPWAYLVGRWVKGIDLRTVGSHNPGALNTYQHVGKTYGLLVLAADVGKGAAAVLIPPVLGAPEVAAAFAGVAVVVGHNWSVFLGFRGGKGAASVLGVFLALFPLLTAVTMAVVFLVVLRTRIVVLGIASGFVLLNILTVATRQELSHILLGLFLTLFVTTVYSIPKAPLLWQAARQRRWKELFLVQKEGP